MPQQINVQLVGKTAGADRPIVAADGLTFSVVSDGDAGTWNQDATDPNKGTITGGQTGDSGVLHCVDKNGAAFGTDAPFTWGGIEELAALTGFGAAFQEVTV